MRKNLHCSISSVESTVVSRASAVRFARASRALLALTCAIACVFGLLPVSASAQTASLGTAWSKVTPAASPSKRFNGGTAYDAAHGVVLLFGGTSDGSTLLNETWTWNGSTWAQQTTTTQPSARLGVKLAYDSVRGNVVLHGGYPNAFNNETWIWNGTTWTQQTPATSPPVRYSPAMAFDAATGYTVLFGGSDTNFNGLNDTWLWNGTTWAKQTPTLSPTARRNFSMVYDAATSTIVMFGGYGSGGIIGDTWTYNGTTWTQQSPASSPTPRYDYRMTYDAATGNVVLFGGTNGAIDYSDTWVWNGTTWTQQSFSTTPPPRDDQYYEYDGATSSIVMFGGDSNSTQINDTWLYVSGTSGSPLSNVGTAAAQTSIYFTIGTAGTLPALSNANVLTQGVSGLDFTLGTGSTCTGTLAANASCVVNVAFTPKYPGQRMGAVNLLNTSGTVIATAFISGTGTGPLATFSPGVLTTLAGTGVTCNPATAVCGDGGGATAPGADFSQPIGVALDGAGNLYIAGGRENRIRKFTAATGLLSTVAGTGTACTPATAACGDGGLATATGANLNNPWGVAVDGAGNLYIADRSDHRIREVNAATGLLSTVAGTGTACGLATAACGDGGLATASGANLNQPVGVAVDGAGNLYIGDSGDNRIRMVTAATGILSTVAGTGSACSPATAACGDGGAATATGANLNYPGGVAVDGAGNLYIADVQDNRVRKVTAATGILSTVAGSGNQCTPATSTCGDGGPATAAGANMRVPYGVSVNAAGDIYIADAGDNRIRKVTAATGYISTVAGTGTACVATASCGDGGAATATSALLYDAIGVALDSAGNLYIADEDVYRVRKVSTSAGITFPTTTAAGTPDMADGTRTATLNNLGNASLTIASMANNNSSFTVANPMTGGCSTGVVVAAGASCLLGESFFPAAGSTGGIGASLTVTDNSLNVASAVQYVPLSGTVTAGAVVLDIGSNIVTAGTLSVNLPVVLGYSGAAADQGAITVMVNGSTAGVNAPASCTLKAGHKNCVYTYTGAALATAGNYTTSVAVAADGANGYLAGSTTGYLTVNGVAGHSHPAPGGPINLPAVTEPVPFHALPVPARTAPLLPAATRGAFVVSSAAVPAASPNSPADPTSDATTDATTTDDQPTTAKKGAKARP